MNRHRIVSVFAGMAFFALLQGSVCLAADAPTKPPTATKEQREKMAQAHEKAATCLRSNRAVAECRQEMMHACVDAMGADGCSKMSGGMMGGNMMHGQPSQGNSPAEPKKP
jgi:hypothetical protein